VHSHCLTGDVFGSMACDCSELVSRSLAMTAASPRRFCPRATVTSA